MSRTFLRLVLGGILGKILGIVREVLLAALFGAGRVVGANRIALSATLIPINFFTADALTAGFLPLYVRYRRDDPSVALALFRGVRLLLVGFATLLLVALLAGRTMWIDLLGPGLDDSTAALAATMLGIATLGVPAYVLYSLYSLVALAADDVRLINLRASFQSIGLIGATLAAYFSGDVTLLAWGFTVPYVALVIFGMYWVRHRGYLVLDGGATVSQTPTRTQYRIALAMFWRRLRPLLLIPVILQGSIAVERAVGSLLGIEVVAATEYARFVVDSCMALIAAPLGLAGLAAFARMEADEVAEGLRRLIAPVLLVMVPLAIVLSVNSHGIITLLYARGMFDSHAVEVSAVLLMGFSLGIWAHVMGYTFVKVLNARGANSRVAVVQIISFSVAAAVNLTLYPYWGPFTLGAAASAGGLVMFVASAAALGVLRSCLRLLALLAPGAVLAAGVGCLITGDGVLRSAVSAFGSAVIWLLWVLLVPGLRHIFVTAVWSKVIGRVRRGRRAEADAKNGLAAATRPADTMDDVVLPVVSTVDPRRRRR